MKYCPFCLEQGIINFARIKDTDIEIYICDECDTIWKTRDITKEKGERFDEFMKKINRRAIWNELVDIRYMNND